MLRLNLIVALLLAAATAEAVTEDGTRVFAVTSASQSSISLSVTTGANTESLLCIASWRGNGDFSSIVFNTSESLSALFTPFDGTGTGHLDYGAFALLNPTPSTTANVVLTIDSSVDVIDLSCIMHDALDDSSLANAFNVYAPNAWSGAYGTEAADGTTVPFDSNGSAGNAFIFCAVKGGADSGDDPTFDGTGYTEIFQHATGTQNNMADHGMGCYQKLSSSGAESGTISLTGGSDPRAGVHIEIVNEPAGADTDAAAFRRLD